MEERQWILKLISEAMIEPNDYNVLQKRFGIKLCLSLFGSCMSDMVTRKLILIILLAALHHPSVARDLLQRHNLHSWIALTIQRPWLTQWEVSFLCQLFVKLVEQTKVLRPEKEETKDNGANTDRFKTHTCRMVGKKVLKIIFQTNGVAKETWHDKISQLLGNPENA